MKKYLRIAIALNGATSNSFNTVLSHLVSYVIFNSKSPQMNLTEISKAVYEMTDLRFGENEISCAIKKGKDAFVQLNNKYSISPKERNKHIKAEKEFDLTSYVSNFLLHIKGSEAETSKIKDLLMNFFYLLFDSNKDDLLALLSSKYYDMTNATKTFSNQEKEIIISFLEWENLDKDKVVYNIIKSAYEYCILTLKEDINESVFLSKKFYLDTNVIFSLIGINGDDKKEATESFVSKCKEMKSQIWYTEKTLSECKNTLSSIIDRVERLVKGQDYFTSDNFRSTFRNSSISIVYNMYLNWSYKSTNRSGDFPRFRLYMDELLTEKLNLMNYAPIPSEIMQNNDLIESKSSSLSAYKCKKEKHFTESSIVTDVINYLYVENIRNKNSINLTNQKSFFISMDNAFISWAAENRGDYTSLIVHPNIMYSILLKFTNRTKNDYRSFNNFISLGIYSDSDLFGDLKFKEEIVKIINDLDEPSNVKSKILYISNNMLSNNGEFDSRCSSVEPVEVVEKSKAYFYNELNKKNEKEKQELITHYTQEIESIKIGNQKTLEETAEQKYKEGANNLLLQISTKKARIKSIRNRIVRWLLFIALLAGVITAVIFGILFFVNEGVNSVVAWISLVSGIIGIICSVVIPLFKRIKTPLFKLLERMLPIDTKKLAIKYYEQLKNDYK